MRSFVKENISLIDTFQFEALYNKLKIGSDDVVSPFEMTQLFNMININPLDHMSVIPASYLAFCQDVEQFVIPDNITKIGDSAFFKCTNLREISIPSTVTTIDDYAFYGCSCLKNLTIPNSVTSIGKDAFQGCSSLDDITIPGSVRSIGKTAFWNCTGLENVVIEDGLVDVPCAFYGCYKLERITIPKSVKHIQKLVTSPYGPAPVLYYCGTTQEFTSISKEANWCIDYQVVVCSDGPLFYNEQ